MAIFYVILKEKSHKNKCKPLAVSITVEDKTRKILEYEVHEAPASGLLVYKLLKKYGKGKTNIHQIGFGNTIKVGPFRKNA